jgi:hypothetical protein
MNNRSSEVHIFDCLPCGRRVARRTIKSKAHQQQLDGHCRPITQVYQDADLDVNGQPDWSKPHDCPRLTEEAR